VLGARLFVRLADPRYRPEVVARRKGRHAILIRKNRLYRVSETKGSAT